jgi:hypothetical protein
MNKTALQMQAQGGIDPRNGPPCPYCDNISILVSSVVIYGPNRNFGNIWVCGSYPRCKSYVGTHSKGPMKDYPLGRLANEELREAKKKAHRLFDTLWKEKGFSRRQAYRWLQEITGLPKEEAHIGEMDVDQCEAVCRMVETAPTLKKVKEEDYDWL